jgi:predicted nuclease with TOPRIM domain
MSSNLTQTEEYDFRLDRRRLSELIKQLDTSEGKLQKRLDELKQDVEENESSKPEEPIYDL